MSSQAVVWTRDPTGRRLAFAAHVGTWSSTEVTSVPRTFRHLERSRWSNREVTSGSLSAVSNKADLVRAHVGSALRISCRVRSPRVIAPADESGALAAVRLPDRSTGTDDVLLPGSLLLPSHTSGLAHVRWCSISRAGRTAKSLPVRCHRCRTKPISCVEARSRPRDGRGRYHVTLRHVTLPKPVRRPSVILELGFVAVTKGRTLNRWAGTSDCSDGLPRWIAVRRRSRRAIGADLPEVILSSHRAITPVTFRDEMPHHMPTWARTLILVSDGDEGDRE